jgi:hypothetical protein
MMKFSDVFSKCNEAGKWLLKNNLPLPMKMEIDAKKTPLLQGLLSYWFIGWMSIYAVALYLIPEIKEHASSGFGQAHRWYVFAAQVIPVIRTSGCGTGSFHWGYRLSYPPGIFPSVSLCLLRLIIYSKRAARLS